jgi:hypothetical protein
MWAPFFGAEEGYKLNRLIVFVTELYGAAGSAINVGTSAAGSGAVFVSGATIPNATGANSVFELNLNGAGAGKDPLADGNSAYLIGGPNNQQLTVSVAGGSGGTGKFVLYAELIPVTGTRFSN